jgi:cytochrome c-type biogenesis protein CcmH/NrfF
VEAIPGGQPGVPDARPGSGPPAPRPPLSARAERALAWLAVAAAGALALGLATYAGVKGRGGVADALRVGAACIAVFGVAGFGPTRLLLPAGLRRHELLWVLPVGAVATALELALLVYAFVPFDVALAIVLLAGAVLAVVAWRRDPGLPGARSARPPSASWRTLLVPLYLAALVAAIALVPMFRGGFVTVIGNGSDAHLAVGTADFLQRHHPNAVAPEEPVDRVPLVWRSKPPIYLAFGAVARVAGMEPYAVIATLQAALLALAALGFWLLARELLGANPWAAGAAMGLVGLNRIELFTAMHPYFNQTWGYMAMPFAIVLAWHVVRRRTRGGMALFAAFLGVLTFAYPLAMPIPLIAAIVFWGFERRRQGRSLLRVPRLRSRRQLLWIVPLFFLLLLPLQGVLEKTASSTRVLAPGYSLVNWGGDLTAFFPERFFLGFGDAGMAAVGVVLLAAGLLVALRGAPRDIRWGLGAVVAFGVLAALYFRPRDFGWYFHFKALAFAAPLAVAVAAVGLARLRWKWAGVLALVFLVGATRDGAAQQIGATFDQLPKSLLELERVDAALPPDASVRLDMPADGRMLWAGILMPGQPLCSQRPVLETSYPHTPVSRAADFVLVDDDWRTPFDAAGPPVMTLDRYRLFRLRPGLPGGDRCSRKMVLTVKKLHAGGKDVE